mgnify:CR=1 FL=1
MQVGEKPGLVQQKASVTNLPGREFSSKRQHLQKFSCLGDKHKHTKTIFQLDGATRNLHLMRSSTAFEQSAAAVFGSADEKVPHCTKSAMRASRTVNRKPCASFDVDYDSQSCHGEVGSTQFSASAILQPGMSAAASAAQAVQGALREALPGPQPAVTCSLSLPVWWVLRHADVVPLSVLASLLPPALEGPSSSAAMAEQAVVNSAEHSRNLEPSAKLHVKLSVMGSEFSGSAEPNATDAHIAKRWSAVCATSAPWQSQALGTSKRSTSEGMLRPLRKLQATRPAAALWNQVRDEVMKLVPPPVHAALAECVFPVWDAIGLDFDSRRRTLVGIVASVQQRAASRTNSSAKRPALQAPQLASQCERSSGLLQGAAFGGRHNLTCVTETAKRMRQHVGDLQVHFGSIAAVGSLDACLPRHPCSVAKAPLLAADIFWGAGNHGEQAAAPQVAAAFELFHRLEACKLALFGVLLAVAALWPACRATQAAGRVTAGPGSQCDQIACGHGCHTDCILKKLEHFSPSKMCPLAGEEWNEGSLQLSLVGQLTRRARELQREKAGLLVAMRVRASAPAAVLQGAQAQTTDGKLRLDPALGLELSEGLQLGEQLRCWTQFEAAKLRASRAGLLAQF